MDYIDNLVLIIVCIAEVYIFYDFFNNYFDKKSEINSNRAFFITAHGIVVILLYLVNIHGNAIMNLIGFLIILWVYISSIFSANLGKRLVYFLLTFSVFWGCEFLFVVFFNITAKEGMFENISSIPLQMLTMKLMTYLILTVIKQISAKSKSKRNERIFMMFICVPVSSLGILLSTFYMEMDLSHKPILKIIMVFCFSWMLLGNILVFYVYNHYSQELYNSAQQKIVIDKQKSDIKYYKQMAELSKKHDEFVHNTTHYLKMIGRFAKLSEYDQILKIVRELDGDIESRELMLYSNNHILNVILSEKRSEAEGNKVKFDAYVEPGTVLGMVSDVDLIAMLGNLLDNAIRGAAQNETYHWVKLRIFMHNIGGFCVVKIENSFSGKLKETEEGIVSTKTERGIHGIGIRSVKNMAKKYGGCFNCRTKDNIFEVIVLLSTDY